MELRKYGTAATSDFDAEEKREDAEDAEDCVNGRKQRKKRKAEMISSTDVPTP